MNTIGADTVQMTRDALKEVEEKFDGLVIGNQAENFSAGANLMLMLFEIQDENWDDIEAVLKAFQDSLMAVKYFEKPVVAAPFGLTLAGGCEVCLACDKMQAAAETYMGLVEVGVGLIPAGGGTKEMLLALQNAFRRRSTQTIFHLFAGLLRPWAWARWLRAQRRRKSSVL